MPERVRVLGTPEDRSSSPGRCAGPCSRGKPPRTLFDKQQRAFFEQSAPPELALDDVVPLGPITVAQAASSCPAGFDRQMVAELWTYPDGSRILELSTKCEPVAAFAVAAETRAFLESRGIDLSGVQQTKTKIALEYFARASCADPRRRSDLRLRRTTTDRDVEKSLRDRRHGGQAPPAGGRPRAGQAVPHPDRRRTHPGPGAGRVLRSSTSAARTARRSSSSSRGPGGDDDERRRVTARGLTRRHS